jgi:hypothetical protein
LHHALRDAFIVVRRLDLRTVEALVLPQADRPLPAPRERIVTAAAGVLQDAEHVVAVEDAELLLQPEAGSFGTKDAHAERVEGADDQVLRRTRADQRLRALAHFGRSLVRERDRRDLPRLVAGLQQPRNLVRDHARLAGARTGQH